MLDGSARLEQRKLRRSDSSAVSCYGINITKLKGNTSDVLSISVSAYDRLQLLLIENAAFVARLALQPLFLQGDGFATGKHGAVTLGILDIAKRHPAAFVLVALIQ
jgi:hypothetical protein